MKKPSNKAPQTNLIIGVAAFWLMTVTASIAVGILANSIFKHFGGAVAIVAVLCMFAAMTWPYRIISRLLFNFSENK